MEQLEAIQMVRGYLRGISRSRKSRIKQRIRNYLKFRNEVADFQKKYFSEICTQKCFADRTSACCSREGIATFFADVVINLLISSKVEIDTLLQTLSRDPGGYKCVYLTGNGCIWRLKPVVCEMFLCDHAKETVLGRDESLGIQWERLRLRERRYTWPDRRVLFDELEEIFIRAGYGSPLMYFHLSPGLLRVKARSRKTKSYYNFADTFIQRGGAGP